MTESSYPAESAASRRWAIVAADPQAAVLADLLTAELSRWPDLQLVERDRIEHVLDELKLNASGLVESERTTRFGQVSGADALLLPETLDKPDQKGLRLRLVETRTSVRLLDVLLPRAGADKDLPAVLALLKQASQKLSIPDPERRYVGVLAIKSEESGEVLKPFCRTLTALVEADLQRRPKLIVLERGQLSRLTAEQDLAGVELQLRSAAWLLEASLRRAEGNRGFVLACRLLSPAQGRQRAFRLDVASQELVEVRRQLLAAVVQALGVDGSAEAVDLAAEAATFARRRDWFSAAYRDEEAAEMAEAALALAPTPENLRFAFQAYDGWAHGKQSALKFHEALPAARRLVELRLEWLRKSTPGSALRKELEWILPFRPHVRLPLEPESDEDRRLRAETDRLSQELWEVLYAEAAADPARRLTLLLHRLEYAAYLSETGPQFADALPPLIEQTEVVLQETRGARSFQNPQYPTFARLLNDLAGQSLQNCRRSSRGLDQRDWELDQILPLWRRLVAHSDPAVRAAGLSALVSSAGDEGLTAARELLSVVQQWPEIAYGGQNVSDLMIASALSRLRDTPAGPEFMERLLRQAEEHADTTCLVRYSRTITSLVIDTPRQRQHDWGQRILNVLDRSPAAADPAGRAAGFRRAIEKQLQDTGVRPTPASLLAAATGPWQDYVARPVSISGPDQERGGIAAVIVDPRPDARARGGELVVVRWYRGLAVERVGLAGGMPRKFGPNVPGSPEGFRGMPVAVGPDAVFLALEKQGLVMVRADGLEVFGEQHGAPASQIMELAWFKDRLYVAYRDAFASFDPVTKSFRLLASSISVEPRNGLDGRGSFFITTLLPDEPQGCLWLCVQDNALPRERNGAWRFAPDRDTFQRLDHNRAPYAWSDHLSWCDGNLLWYLSDRKTWSLLDPATARATPLNGYAKWTPSPLVRFPEGRFVKVGAHIICASGQLFTSDGAVHRVSIDTPWNFLQRVGPGFLTHYDEKAKVLWYVEPKAGAQTPFRDPAEVNTSRPTE
ncbi:MAG: hypothetical protein NTY19_26415 [Planctomycetota bacterium]|nr:hypothetical protein [Planctomycetota bacterium]